MRDNHDDRNAADRAPRRPYAPPRILSREPLEVIAALCSPPGKADAGACPSGPISS